MTASSCFFPDETFSSTSPPACARQLIIRSRPSVYRFGEQDEVESAFRWSSSAGLSFDVRRTSCLIAWPRTDESVCISLLPVAAVWISAVIAPAAGQTQASDGFLPPFCRISHVLRRKRRRCFDRRAVRFLTALYASLKCRSFFVDVERKNVPRGCFILPL